MKIVILHLWVGAVLLCAYYDPPERHQLTRRLAALRNWPMQRNRRRRH